MIKRIFKTRYLLLKIGLTLISPIVLIGLLYIIVNKSVEENVSSEISDIKYNRVGLVLGTSKRIGNGTINLFFKYRIQATLDLFHAGKIDYILVSGDNSRQSYDEPTDFKNALIKGGVPADKIYLDYAGFRTLDSIVRAKKVFGLNKFTIISQEFHNQRALYLAQHYNIDAVAYNANEVLGQSGFKVKLREYLARTKMFIDLLLHTQPKYLGQKIQIV